MDIHRFDPVRARYVRLRCTEHAVQWQTYCIFDLGVYEDMPEQGRGLRRDTQAGGTGTM
jgi:hypothetical protein